MTSKMVLVVPFTGLGLYGGFRGNRWLRNRIAVFERFVIPSLLNQTDRDFLLWVCWRPEERTNKLVVALKKRLEEIPNFKVVFSYEGIPMYDDKYDHAVAVDRLANTLNRVQYDLINVLTDCEEIYWLLQPSDDCYDKNTVASVKAGFAINHCDALSFTKGYLCNYTTKEVLEYNPKTNPPFAAIRFKREVFFDPAKHLKHISLKQDADKYKMGTPLPSHEYLPKCLTTLYFEGRGFLVGTHGENISTHFNHPYGGARFEGIERDQILDNFGLANVEPIQLPFSLRKWIMRHLPHQWRRKLRYWFGEIWGQRIYQWIRN